MDRVTTIPPHLFQTSGKLGFRRLASGGRCSSRRPRRREGRSSVSILSSVDHPPSLSLAAIALFHWHCTMASRRNVGGYAPLPTEDRDDSNLTDDTFGSLTPQNPSEKSRGSHMEGDNSQAYGLLFLGILAFLPGFYETRVAYYSSRGAPGYTFASIPDY
uniref:Uncharacterized protein n=1 Tax=Oryza nivara TaxID=4536 RepID=A0A0E0IXR8_ORYNI